MVRNHGRPRKSHGDTEYYDRKFPQVIPGRNLSRNFPIAATLNRKALQDTKILTGLQRIPPRGKPHDGIRRFAPAGQSGKLKTQFF
jgi:hypothetical protein